MSYHSTTRRPRQQARMRRMHRPGPMGDDWIDIAKAYVDKMTGDSGLDPSCSAASDNKTASLDQQTNALAANWAADNGMYTPADMAKLRDQVMALLLAADQALDAAIPSATSDMIANIRQAQVNIQSKESDSLKYTTTINDAVTKGIQQISSTDFKDWVINSMNKASVGIGFATYINCIKSTTLAALVSAFQTAWDTLVSLIQGLVKFAQDTAKLVAKVPDTVSDIMDYLKYGALVAGGYMLFNLLTKKG